MKLHPRMLVVAEAKLEHTKAFLAIEEKHELTYGEMFQILSEQTERLAMYLIREERHSGEDKKGDEA
jgi:hypothetical protein